MKNIVIITKFIRNVFFKIISSTFSFEMPRCTAGYLTFSLIFSDSEWYRLVMEKNSGQLEQYLSKYLHPKYVKKIMKSLSYSGHRLTKNKFYLQGNSWLSFTHIFLMKSGNISKGCAGVTVWRLFLLYFSYKIRTLKGTEIGFYCE